jgi:outer membrane protein OmpU
MKTITKVGLSALCGSLAAISSANAGDLNVKGGATATWSSNQGDNTGNPIGLSSGITFTGAGELDNGSTFSLTLTNADQSAFSAASIAIVTPTMGKISIAAADGGNGIGGYDDKMPTAWEETWGTSLATGIDLAKGVGSSMNVAYTTPTLTGTTLSIAWAPQNGGGVNNDKASGGDKGDNLGTGVDFMVNTNQDLLGAGIQSFVGYSNTERDAASKTGTDGDPYQDREEGVLGAIVTVGPVVVGLQKTIEYTGNTQTETDVWGYANTGYGLSFNVNDNLSLSYGKMESKKGFVSKDSNEGGSTDTVKMIVESYQVAYTIGGASLKIAESEVENQTYSKATGMDKDGTTIALSLAF